MTLGKLLPPYPVNRCANQDCVDTLTEEIEAHMFMDLDTEKITVFCGPCAQYVELQRQDRWRLILL